MPDDAETTDWDNVCVYCGRHNEAVSGKAGDVPDDGDVLICWDCRGVYLAVLVDGELRTRRPTPAEHAKLMATPQVQEALLLMDGSRTPRAAAALLPEAFDA